MEIQLPEELSDARLYEIVEKIRETMPVMYADCVKPTMLTKSQKQKILDHMLMEYPHVYALFFK